MQRRQFFWGTGIFLILVLIPGLLLAGSIRKQVFFVQSYEPGVGCGALIEKGLLKGLKDLGYEDGENIDIVRLSLKARMTNITPEKIQKEAKDTIYRIRDKKPDLVVIFDDIACEHVMLPLAKTDIPIVFTGMNVSPEFYNTRREFMVSRANPSFNITGVTEEADYIMMFRLMHRIFPRARRFAVTYSCNTPFNVRMFNEFQEQAGKIEKSCQLSMVAVQPVGTVHDFKQVVSRFNGAKDIDFVFDLCLSSLLDDQGKVAPVNQVIQWMSLNQKKPGCTFLDSRVKEGYLTGTVINLEECGRQASRQVVQILEGANPGDLPIERPADIYIAVNRARAEHLGIKLPGDIIEAAKVVYHVLPAKPKRQ
ncbi:MAG: hypothetical protein J7L53_05165 [Deltaproteobacteria bacterium]|nr:hypothetical protein [Deltaproteobacteria bacterium]